MEKIRRERRRINIATSPRPLRTRTSDRVLSCKSFWDDHPARDTMSLAPPESRGARVKQKCYRIPKMKPSPAIRRELDLKFPAVESIRLLGIACSACQPCLTQLVFSPSQARAERQLPACTSSLSASRKLVRNRCHLALQHFGAGRFQTTKGTNILVFFMYAA